jgi:hypothetical protein
MIVPGDPDASSLTRMLDWGVSPDIRMPHGKRQLSICDRDLIRTWIFEGAKNNRGGSAAPDGHGADLAPPQPQILSRKGRPKGRPSCDGLCWERGRR